MKKITLIISLIIFSSNSFALTQQIKQAEKILQTNYKEFINSVYTKEKEINVLQKSNNLEEIILDKRTNNIETNSNKYIETNKDIYKGQKNDAIQWLKKQLNLEINNIYDESLFEYVKTVQKSSGLNPTGIIDRNTWFVLYNQPIEWKIQKTKESLEGWLNIIEKNKNNKSDKMIVINIPSMKLYVYQKNMNNEEYSLLLDSPVVIGRTITQTPLNDFYILSIKYNPTWTPTKNILKRHLYKNGELNVKWLEDHHLSLIDNNGEEVEYTDIDSIQNPKFVQSSGDFNALGNLKFETSSNEDIYLHDTNERHLFNFNTRTYSSGCIRVKNYINLASILAEKDVNYIQKNINKKVLFYEKLPQKIPVYFDYSQVFFDNHNIIYFSDIYNKKKY